MSALRVGIVGPLLGRHAGWVGSPGLALAERLSAGSTTVRTTSRHVHRVPRTLDVASVAARWRGRVDVVLVLVFSGGAFVLSDLGLRAGRLAGARTVAWLHGGGLPEQAERRPDPVDRLLARADAVVAPSTWLADWAEARGHATTVVPNLVDPGPVFHPREVLRPRLLWMRTYHDLYDPLLAVHAVEVLHAHRPDVRLTLAGQDRGLQQSVADEVHRRGLDGAVEVRGFATDEEKARLFAEHDVFLSTNRVDNAPVTVVEAGQAGLPVVAVAAGGLPALLDHGEGGVLVPDRSPAAVADAVLGLLEDRSAAARIVAAGRRRGDAHRWPAVGPRWHALLEQVAGG